MLQSNAKDLDSIENTLKELQEIRNKRQKIFDETKTVDMILSILVVKNLNNWRYYNLDIAVNHLSYTNQVNYGSYCTPKKYVDLVKMWMHEYGINGQYTIMDIILYPMI